MTPAAQARAATNAQQMLAAMLHVQQPAIAKMEKRTDMYLSTLRSHIEAMGGQLEVIARFPGGVVKISNFSELDQSAVTCPIAVTRGGEVGGRTAAVTAVPDGPLPSSSNISW